MLNITRGRRRDVVLTCACMQAICKKSLEQVALKVYHMANLCELNHYQVFREIRVHSNLSHQHIIALYCAFQVGRVLSCKRRSNN